MSEMYKGNFQIPEENPEDSNGWIARGKETNFSGWQSKPLGVRDRQWHDAAMEHEIRRLEDRIKHVDDMAQARLETALARIDGTFSRIDARFEKLDARFEVIQSDISTLKGGVSEFKALNQQTRNTVIVTGIGTVLAILGLLIGLKQVWIGGVQVGQADRVVQVAPAPSR